MDEPVLYADIDVRDRPDTDLAGDFGPAGESRLVVVDRIVIIEGTDVDLLIGASAADQGARRNEDFTGQRQRGAAADRNCAVGPQRDTRRAGVALSSQTVT